MIGAVSYSPDDPKVAVFEYNPKFLDSGIQLAPIQMKLGSGVFHFPGISPRTFYGLPGMLADSLPDRFGNQLIDKHMASKGIRPEDITAIDRLHYVGNRAMGALEYQPAEEIGRKQSASGRILDLAELTELANLTLSRTEALAQKLADAKTEQAAFDLLRVGTSAGGARAKALIALDAKNQPKVGHLDHGIDHTYWLLKFDGIHENKDREGRDPPGITVLEYVYSILAGYCGIQMPRCRLWEQGEQRHFLIERFDRVPHNGKLDKLHYTSWSGMAHAHRDQTNVYSYEQLILVLRQLGLAQADITELYRRAVFNIVGRNQDDHTKNFGFLMNRLGEWRLSPAFDLNYAHDPQGQWTRTHQISLNGKVDGFTRDDLIAFGKFCNFSPKEAAKIIGTTIEAFGNFEGLAMHHQIPVDLRRTVQGNLRLKI